jgi:hypothetical protein
MRRRQFLGALIASAGVPALSWADAGDPMFLAAAREADGAYALFGLDQAGQDLFRIPLPTRGHAATAHPSVPEAVAFARRPGTYALVIDCVGGAVTHRLQAPKGRHFYGHGAFIADGDLLVTSENDIATGQGVLGLWSRREGYRRVGERASGGVGPHEILHLGNDILAVANGGIHTHPDRGREKLNLGTMRPNLSYVTLDGVQEVVTLAPELHQLSIRHLAAQGGQVAFAMQYQGDPSDEVPLLGLHRRGAAPVLAQADFPEQLAMKGYAGSVASAGDEVASTSPRGGRVHLFDRAGGFVRSTLRRDVCGVSAGAQGLVVTDGMGGVLRLDAEGARALRKAPRAWDNHLIRLG